MGSYKSSRLAKTLMVCWHDSDMNYERISSWKTTAASRVEDIWGHSYSQLHSLHAANHTATPKFITRLLKEEIISVIWLRRGSRGSPLNILLSIIRWFNSHRPSLGTRHLCLRRETFNSRFYLWSFGPRRDCDVLSEDNVNETNFLLS